jgi:hypothetical protein
MEEIYLIQGIRQSRISIQQKYEIQIITIHLVEDFISNASEKTISFSRRLRNIVARLELHNHLQCHNNTIYYLGFNKRLISLNIDNNVVMFPKFLKCLAAAFRSYILKHIQEVKKEVTKQS